MSFHLVNKKSNTNEQTEIEYFEEFPEISSIKGFIGTINGEARFISKINQFTGKEEPIVEGFRRIIVKSLL
jgi:hypothetical protein